MLHSIRVCYIKVSLCCVQSSLQWWTLNEMYAVIMAETTFIPNGQAAVADVGFICTVNILEGIACCD